MLVREARAYSCQGLVQYNIVTFKHLFLFCIGILCFSLKTGKVVKEDAKERRREGLSLPTLVRPLMQVMGDPSSSHCSVCFYLKT